MSNENHLIDTKYANLISHKLELFRWEKKNVANFRCPVCTDSKKNKTKKRGYLYFYKEKMMFICHNCGVSLPLGAFIKQLDEQLYKEYVRESFKFDNEHRWFDVKAEKREERVVTSVVEEKKKFCPLDKLISIMDLPDEHICKIYVRKRKIPLRYWRDLFYTSNYQKWVNECVDKESCKKHGKYDPRLIIPFKNKEGNIFAYQGRYIGEESYPLRYITITVDDNETLIYGQDKVDTKKDVFVFEGPLDSMYVANSLAVAGSGLSKMRDNYIFVFDNEPRSKEICTLMEKVIKDGKRIVIWPKNVILKDVGEMIEFGISRDSVLDMLNDNIYTSLQAELMFNDWKLI